MKLLIALMMLASCSSHAQKYYRKHWKHWSDQNKNCINTRSEILKARSLVPVQMNKRGCKVKTGQWQDYYFPEQHTEARKVDIDHLIPLKHAHDSGGSKWTPEQKEKFANDPENLVITDRKYNRKKGAKTIAQWLPLHKEYACKYVKDWVKIKSKYQLKLGQAEIQTMEQLKDSCP